MTSTFSKQEIEERYQFLQDVPYFQSGACGLDDCVYFYETEYEGILIEAHITIKLHIDQKPFWSFKETCQHFDKKHKTLDMVPEWFQKAYHQTLEKYEHSTRLLKLFEKKSLPAQTNVAGTPDDDHDIWGIFDENAF